MNNSVSNQIDSGIPAWMAVMRSAAMKAIGEDDIEQMIRAQVEAAKKGDRKALEFVFNTVLGGASLRGATFVQNVFTSDSSPALPTPERPGSNKKLDVMAARAAAGLPLHQVGDGGEPDLS